jgi:phospholipid/cholesterol/gamma-HCH transport system permease protein
MHDQVGNSRQPKLQWRIVNDNIIKLTSTGEWTHSSAQKAKNTFDQLLNTCLNKTIQWDVSGIKKIDSAGMMLIIYYYDWFQSNNCHIALLGANSEFSRLYELLRKYSGNTIKTNPAISSQLLLPLESIGKNSISFFLGLKEFLAFIGENFITFIYSLTHLATVRFRSIIKNIEDAGVRAIPIVALTSFLIGIVIAYQGAVQLEKFGANIFIVDMIGISITRELAPLITAIVVAGRTGSSYTAQLGVMKITEEIDAMRTMGFDPHQFLVLPRIFALMITLPLLILFADIIGILAGMLISHLHLHLSYAEFFHRLQTSLDVKHVWIGIGKGPFFAWLIASVGCFHGFQVSQNTESIGRYTTISVVNAIFLVIACDAIFSVILTELGI